MMRTKQIELYQQQYDFLTTPERFTAFIGGIGSGKTWVGCVKGIKGCQRHALGLIVAPTYRMLMDATLRTFQEIAGDVIRDFHKGEMRADVGNAEVLFRSATDPETLRGPSLDWAYIDEGALCDKMTWRIVIGRLRAGGKAGPCWVTSTPKGRNWVWQEFVKEQRPAYRIFRARTRDNPYLAEEYIKDLEDSYTGDFARQELLGEFVSFEGLVYEEFDRTVHVGQPRKGLEFSEVVAGVDWGYSNPAVILVIGLDGDGRAYVVEEWYQRRKRIGQIAQEAKRLADKWDASAMFECDPSEPANIYELVAANVNARGANNAVQEGIQVVKARLAVQGDGRTRLLISPTCVNLIAEMESYCWKENKLGLKDEPEKANDHAVDALRYALMGVERRGVYFM